MRNDDIILTSVKMPFTEEDKHAIKILHEEKQYSSRHLLYEFPSKNWTRHGLDHLLKKTDNTGSIKHCCGSGRPQAVRTVNNVKAVVDAVADRVQRQEDKPQTHHSVRQIQGWLIYCRKKYTDIVSTTWTS